MLIFDIIVNFTKETINTMESKLNREALKEYSRNYSRVIESEFFQLKEEISGKEILDLCEIHQINLFIIYQILSKWNEESKHLKSDYFDYSSPEVRKELAQFLNTLSRHIRIKKEIFVPLLNEAIEDTILLILSPYEYYCDIINRRKSTGVNVKAFNDLLKYIKINQQLFRIFIIKLDQLNQKKVPVENALKILNEVFENTDITPEDVEGYVAVLSKIQKLPLDVIYGSEEENMANPLNPENVSEKSELKTLNDKLTGETNTMLHQEIKKKTRRGSIKKQLNINQKFMFINQLFDGNSDDFNSVIDFLENCETQAQAMDFINNNYLKKNNWKKDSQEVKEFIEVIALKYT